MFAAFDPDRADFLRRLVASGKTGRIWTSLDPDEAATALGEERSRIVAALGHLEQRGLIELRAADARQRYTVLDAAGLDGGAARPSRRAVRAPRAGRGGPDRSGSSRSSPTTAARSTRSSATSARCATSRAATARFCLTGAAQQLPEAVAPPPLDAVVDRPALDALAAAHPEALGAPRQRARFLCGITSPATSRAKLTREALFGALADRRFADVLAWCETA